MSRGRAALDPLDSLILEERGLLRSSKKRDNSSVEKEDEELLDELRQYKPHCKVSGTRCNATLEEKKNLKITRPPLTATNRVMQAESSSPLLPVYSLDCEMVEVTRGMMHGSNRRRLASALARCTIVDDKGAVVLDQYVRPQHKYAQDLCQSLNNGRISNYRTAVSGIHPHHLSKAKARPIKHVRAQVSQILRNSIVVGHDLRHDFGSLGLCPTRLACHVRDSAKSNVLRQLAGLDAKLTPSLKTLSRLLLDREIQTGEHCSVQDAVPLGLVVDSPAQAAVDLYLQHREEWESELSVDDL